MARTRIATRIVQVGEVQLPMHSGGFVLRNRPIARALLRLSVSSVAGTFVGGVLVTLWVAVMNLRADDGPYFPPPFVAFVVVLPVTLTLLPFQAFVELVHAGARRLPWWAIEAVGVAGGLSAAFLLCRFFFEPSPSQRLGTVTTTLVFCLLQALVALSSQRVLAPRRRAP